ncbi:MAG: phosphatase PAP2 family protein [Bacteroidetes bacterium]|nr:phosphatase PAP2 family protein [Bacteroidota bacterium]MBT6688074.1 phosphatase PAP2 family protein [Bacteroidota bacterium]MBT7142327.1 phosphatase PAP2 family protein [Bacteroidota bacterium]MBT7491141.1 phosphatase PAP2 family protein [Bacteroidota bacterium]
MKLLEYINFWDTKLFLVLNSFHSPLWDDIMWWISATYTWIPLYLFVLFFIFKEKKWKGFFTLFALILMIVLADQISVHLFKEVFERLRPCHNPDISEIVHIVKNKCGGKYGFVSSHAANTFSFALFSAIFFRKLYYTILIIAWASIVSYSRIYLGVHYPGDVVGGAILGLLLGFLVFYIYNFFERKWINQLSIEN